jgi:rhamnosyltransferase
MKSFITKDNLCAIVTWYNPTAAIAQNVQQYAGHVRHVFVVDNSDVDHRVLLDTLGLTNALYHFTGENKGIAAALNIGFKYADSYQMEWALTMDQDSIFEGNRFAEYLAEVNNYTDYTDVGIFSVKHDFGQIDTEQKPAGSRYCEKKRVMCSGNLIALDAYRKAGAYREDFFMDWIDFEFCARVKAAGYRIIECTHVLLKHFLGDRIMQVKRFGSTKYIPDYPVWRKYYLVRNILHTAKAHKALRNSMRWRLFQEFQQVLWYDSSPKKWKKLRAMYAALRHARKPIIVTDIQQKYP